MRRDCITATSSKCRYREGVQRSETSICPQQNKTVSCNKSPKTPQVLCTLSNHSKCVSFEIFLAGSQ